MNKKIKLIGLDLDGTTLDENSKFSNRTKEAFKRAMGGLLKSQKVEKTEDGFFRLKK